VTLNDIGDHFGSFKMTVKLCILAKARMPSCCMNGMALLSYNGKVR